MFPVVFKTLVVLADCPATNLGCVTGAKLYTPIISAAQLSFFMVCMIITLKYMVLGLEVKGRRVGEHLNHLSKANRRPIAVMVVKANSSQWQLGCFVWEHMGCP